MKIPQKLFKLWPWAVAPISLAIVILLIVFAGWTRTVLIPGFSRMYYWHVSHTYDKEYEPFNAKLHELGFRLVDKATLPISRQGGLQTWQPLHGCKTVGYQSVHITVTCREISEYRPVSLPTFKTQWAKEHTRITSFLKDSGWHKEYSDQPDLSELFSGPQDTGQWLTYVKGKGRQCHLTIAYNPPYQNPDDQVWIHEDCIRDVKFFGGY